MIETIGILSARKQGINWFVEKLYIPIQQGDNVSCWPTDQITYSEAILQSGSVEIGWIHTHPGHDMFFSSVDLHTQNEHQEVMPEYFGIVSSHVQGKINNGILRVKDDYMAEIKACLLPGHHPHRTAEG